MHWNTVFFADIQQSISDGCSIAVNPLVGVLFAHYCESGKTGSAGNWVSVQRANSVDITCAIGSPTVEDGEHISSTSQGCQWITATHDLSGGRHVWRDAEELLGTAVGQPETSDNLIKYQQHPVFLSQIAEALQESGGRGDNPLHRFNDYSSQVV